jgi:hypothetical protein
MGIFTYDNTELAVDLDGLGTQHRAEAGGMLVALERWTAGLDTAEMFADLPGGACQEPHWGYIVAGQVTMRYTDGTSEALSAGQAYYIRPGHNAHVDEDVEIVEFTQAEPAPGINNLPAAATPAPARG